jgi:hypothetical protein
MPLRPALSLLLAALLVAGCMNVSTTLTVRPDGGGTITERLTLNPEAARMMQSMSQALDSTGAPQELFSEEELRAEADSVPGLALQSYTRIDDETGTGYEAVYSFDDLNAAQFDPGPGDVMPDGAAAPTEEGGLDLMSEMSFDFSPGAPATLTIHMPQDPATERMDEGRAPVATTDGPPSGADMEMMRALVQDAGFRLAVTIDGQIVETNATHRSGDTITLMAMDFEALAQDSTAFRELMTMSNEEPAPAAAIDRLNALPGVTVEPQETVTIRFR